MGNVCFTLPGPPEVRHDDQVLLFSTHKELALLIYLAMEGRINWHQKLSEQFWLERRGREAWPGSPAHDPAPPASSAEWGRRYCSCASPPLSHSTCIPFTMLTMPEDAHRALLAQLQRASSLPRGAFLEGFLLRDALAFADWVRFQRDYWYLRKSEIFDCLSHLQFEAGKLKAAIETVGRWLALSTLHEDAYRRLMRVHQTFVGRGWCLVCRLSRLRGPWHWPDGCWPLLPLVARRPPPTRTRSRFPFEIMEKNLDGVLKPLIVFSRGPYSGLASTLSAQTSQNRPVLADLLLV